MAVTDAVLAGKSLEAGHRLFARVENQHKGAATLRAGFHQL